MSYTQHMMQKKSEVNSDFCRHTAEACIDDDDNTGTDIHQPALSGCDRRSCRPVRRRDGHQRPAYNLTAEDYGGEQNNGCIDYLVITRPDVIEEVHASFLAVGSEVVETDTFRANRLTLSEYGLGERVLEINRAAAQLARRVCDRFEAETGIPRLVAGSMGPSGKLPSGDDPDLSNITFDELADVFYEQAQGLVEGGVDLLLLETSQDILEVKAAIVGINRYFADSGQRVPLQAQITLDVTGKMLFGTDIDAAHDHAGSAAHRRAGHELLDRAGIHARAD